MKPTTLLVFATSLFSLAPFKNISANPQDSTPVPPPVSAEEALSLAKAYVQDHHVTTTGQYIDSVQFERHPPSGAAKFWLVTWLDNRYASDLAIKGGQTYVRVHLDKTAEVFYGE